MALTDAEVKQENLGVLRRLALSPGWDLYRTHLLKLVQSREQEKASLLRGSKPTEAMAIQARIDGLMEALTSLDKTIVELQSKQDDTPLY